MATPKNPPLKHEPSAEALRREADQIQERVRQRAFELSEALGSTGNDFHDWLRAEAEIVLRPTFELVETPSGWKAEFAVPGLDASNLEIRLGGGSLVVTGERRQERKKNDERIVVSEYRATSLFREISIPLEVDVEKAKATIEGGVLCVTLPRRKQKAPKKVSTKKTTVTAPAEPKKASAKKAAAKKSTTKKKKRRA
jgi:HSP20 family protein